MTAPVYDAPAFLQALQSLMPRGAAWPRSPDSVQAQAFSFLVQSDVRLNARANNLLAESNPATTSQLLPEWESSLGLPDPLLGQLPTLQARRNAVIARLTNPGGQSAAYFIAQAAALGYTVTITNYAPFRMGQSSMGQPLGLQDWCFTWAMNTPNNAPQPFRVGQSSMGDPLVYWSNTVLALEMAEIAPAHTQLNFNYQ